MGFGTMERREKVKRLNWVLWMGAVLLLGVTALGACPPGILNNTVVGAGSHPSCFLDNVGGTVYSNLEVRGNTINYADAFIRSTGAAYTNTIIADNDAGILDSLADHGINLGASSNVQVLNNRFTYDVSGTAARDGITDAAGATNLRIVGNVITAGHAAARDCISVNGTNVTVEGNTLDARLGGRHAVRIAGINAVVKKNKIVGTRGGHGIDVGATNAVLEENTIQNVTNGNHGINLAAANAQVRGNVIDGVIGGGDGIRVGAGNQVIVANTIKNVDTGHGINVNAQSNNVVEGNVIEDVGLNGIFLATVGAATSNTNVVKANTLRRVCLRSLDAAGQRRAAIYVDDESSNNQVQANVIEDVGGSVWPAWIIGIWIVGDTDGDGNVSMNNSVIENKIRQMTQAGNIATTAVGVLVEAGMNHIVQGNELSNTGNMQIGIDIRATDRMTVKENKVEGMIYAGLYLRGGTVTNRLTVEGNKLTNNYIGIVLSTGAADLTGNVVSGGWTSLLVDRFGVAGQYKLENNCFIKPTGVHVRNDGTGTLTAKKSYWEPTPPSVVGAVDTSDPLASCPGAPAPTPTLSKNYGPRAGWYMVSVPTTGDTAGIFGVTLHWWNGTTYTQYTGTAAIEPVKGYWANLPANKTVTASGSVPTTDQTVALVKGWNMISVPWAYPKAAIQVQKGTETKSWADAVAAGWVRDTIWGSTTAVTRPDDYQSVTTLDPWYGYWVRALVDGLSLKFAYASRLTTLCVSCLEAKAVVPEGEELPPAPPAASAAEFKFVNVPNPIRDVHTTTFKVLGPLSSMVTEIKVQVFDLTGKLVWEGTASGAELTWHTDDLTGAYLANGVYLYKVYVKVGDAWISSGVLKLVIQR